MDGIQSPWVECAERIPEEVVQGNCPEFLQMADASLGEVLGDTDGKQSKEYRWEAEKYRFGSRASRAVSIEHCIHDEDAGEGDGGGLGPDGEHAQETGGDE